MYITSSEKSMKDIIKRQDQLIHLLKIEIVKRDTIITEQHRLLCDMKKTLDSIGPIIPVVPVITYMPVFHRY